MASKQAGGYDPDATRMTVGEHLEELRRRVLISLVALVAACAVCVWPAKYLLELLARPVVLVLRTHGQAENFLATHPAEIFLVYVKAVLVFGTIIAAPVIIYQLWAFVAAGLYPHEKRLVYRFIPVSFGLFAVGVVFMYAFVLVLSLNFLVGFANWLPLPAAQPNAFEQAILRQPTSSLPTTLPAGMGSSGGVALLGGDPQQVPAGTVWINAAERRLKVRGTDGRTYSAPLAVDRQQSMVATHFRIGEYLSFVLWMTVAFGLAFQTPLVVVVLARTGIVPTRTFRSYRRVVILVIVIAAGVLAPPDLLSHLLLSGPMILLFEIGLWLAGRAERRHQAARAATPGGAGREKLAR